jgi:hypothetical protein
LETYSFRTVSENGVITLPMGCENKLVEITVREISNQIKRKRDLLSAVEINTSNWEWTRDEANERR